MQASSRATTSPPPANPASGGDPHRQDRLPQAQRLFETLLALRNPVGLYAEEFGIEDGRRIGNFPQAFSHVGPITAALGLANAQRARH